MILLTNLGFPSQLVTRISIPTCQGYNRTNRHLDPGSRNKIIMLMPWRVTCESCVLQQVAPTGETVMPPLRKFTFVPATGQIIARTVNGDETQEPTQTAQPEAAQASGSKTAAAPKAKTKATPKAAQGSGSKTGAEPPQPDKPKGSLKVAGAEGEENEEELDDDDDEGSADVEDELSAINELQGAAGGRKRKGGKGAKPKKKPKAESKKAAA